ncbi:MAG TPA: carboxypeptidase-like regulatory domain-containing protein [Bacteroidia bacterium]|nr:carboxypeptidase-like regulatory domain-containing protein [Bacteroidia bacterium]
MKLNRYSFFPFLLIFFFIGIVEKSNAQKNAAIRGFVYEKKTGEPVLYASVYLKGTTTGTTTDVNGYFSLSNLAVGSYVLIATSIGYDTVTTDILLTKDQIVTKKLFLQEAGITLGAAEVSGAMQRHKTNVDVGVTVITPEMMKQIPSIGGQADIAQYLQVLPGVVSTGDQGGQLYIEGGQPIQNKVILDGMTIFNPFHSSGLFSVFDGDIISDATVYAGGFNAEYGDRISSIMDIRTRDGNKKKVTGKIDVSPFGAHALVEGPLIKNVNDDPEKASSTFILSVKNSYLGQTSKTLYPYVDSGHGIPFDFADYYGKVSLNTANGSRISIFGFDYNDNVNYPGIDSVGWKEYGVGTNFVLVPSGSSSLLEGNIDFSNYSITEAANGQVNQSGINTFDLGLKFTSFLGNTTLYDGFDIEGTGTSYNFYNSDGRLISDSLTSDEISGYIKLKIISNNKKLILEPGFRVQYYATYSQLSPEPRLDAKYNISDKVRLKFATGLYSQDLISIVDERDVVDLFYGISTSPPTADIPSQFTQQNGTTVNVTNPLQRAYHITGGFEYDPTNRIHVDVEGYYKNFLQTTTLNYDKVYDDNSNNYLIPDSLKKDFLVQSGKAYGADISIRYDRKNLSIYGVYSLGYVYYWDGFYQFPPPFDRRHNVNLVVSYKFGKDLSWMADVRFNYGSGFPFTPTQGYYPSVPFNNIGSNYTSSNASLGTLYGNFDSYRLPDYARLDASIDKSFQLSQDIGLHINASVINALDRANIFYYNRITSQRVNQLPILPSISVAMTF